MIKARLAAIAVFITLVNLALQMPASVVAKPDHESAGIASSTARIAIRDFKFRPGLLRVAPGTVVFSNHDSAPHDATRRRGFSTGRLRRGDSVAIRFTARGVYRYYCSLHPEMRGRIEAE